MGMKCLQSLDKKVIFAYGKPSGRPILSLPSVEKNEQMTDFWFC